MLPVCVLLADVRRLCGLAAMTALLLVGACLAVRVHDARGRAVRSGARAAIAHADTVVAGNKGDATHDSLAREFVVDTLVRRAARQERASTRYTRARAQHVVPAADTATAALLALADTVVAESDTLREVALREVQAADAAIAAQAATVAAQDTATHARDVVIEHLDRPRCRLACKTVLVAGVSYAAVTLAPRALRWLARRALARP